LERIVKSRLETKAIIDIQTDIELINQYALTQLQPEDVFTFSVILCGNEIDRSDEKFSEPCLEELAKLFVGVTGIFNHSWNAKDQVARIYRASVENGQGRNKIGEQLRVIKANAYIPREDYAKEIISKIECGILKEVSVGVALKKCTCSICGGLMKGWWSRKCDNDHYPGKEYDKKLCYGILEEPTDAYEFSFVAVPAQPGAGVTKSVANLDDAFELLMTANLSEQADKVRSLMPQLQKALMDEAERLERAKILSENEAYLKKYAKN